MNQEVSTALAFPRTLIDSQRDLEQCPYHGLYIPKKKCRLCTESVECASLYSNDGFVALSRER